MTNIHKNSPYNVPTKDQPLSPLLLRQWYRLTSSPEPPQEASFAQREAARRGQLTSIVLLFYMIVLLILLPIGFLSLSHTIAFAITGLLILSLISLLFNRLGRPNMAGLLIALGVFAGIVTVILTSPGGLSTTTLGLFYLLVFVEILVASLLPVNWVLLAAAINIAFILLDLSLQQKVPEFAQVMATDGSIITLRIVAAHVFVTMVLWLWVRSAVQALKRADRAEELAMRERQIQELQQAELQQKEELEKGIELILQTHVQVSNGNFLARAPLSQDNQLWQIAYSLNNLIGRLRHYKQAEIELISARETIAHLTHELQEAKQIRRPDIDHDNKDAP